MTGPMLTLALTAHGESVVAGPTLRSAEAAVAAAEAEGVSVELLLGIDTPTDACRAFFSQPALDGWRKLEFSFRDQGAARNRLAREAKGRWLAFLDGDDLFSENWLAEACRLLGEAEARGERIVVHPELNVFFDAHSSIIINIGQDDELFTPYYFMVANYYDALCVAPTAAWTKIPFAARAISEGYAFEDWQWAVETMAAGWRHVVAQDTIVFKRRRDASQTHESQGRSATIRTVEPMAIDRLMTLGRTMPLRLEEATQR